VSRGGALPGRFIVLEGTESSGKSTQAARLARRLGALLTREPGGTELGEAVRGLLLEPSPEPIDARAELLLVVAARAQHVALRILPELTAGRSVVCDRFHGSTLAYQGYGRGLPLEDVRRACSLAAGTLEPDLVVLLDVPEDVSASRRRRSPDRIESQDASFHRRVRAGFLELARADPARWVAIDASGDEDDVERLVTRAVERRLGMFGSLPVR
jgi:dTMP kinase